MGRRKREGNNPPPKKNKIQQDLERNEENRYPYPDSNKTKVNYTNEPQEVLKEEILQVINENFIEMLLDVVNQNIQEALKKIPREQK
jgi:hypothetical protein